MGYIRCMGIHKMVFDGLVNEPDKVFREEIMHKIADISMSPSPSRHLAGSVLFWIAMNGDDYHTIEEYTVEGQNLIRSFCEAESIDEGIYRDLVEGCPSISKTIGVIESSRILSGVVRNETEIKDDGIPSVAVHSMNRSQLVSQFGSELQIETCVGYPDDQLEKYRPTGLVDSWELVVSGYWSEDSFHSGHIAYYICKTDSGIWIMDGVERHAVLDGITEEDVEEGRLDDDQVQAMWGISLEEAQNFEYRRIVAVCFNAPLESSSKDIAAILYDAVEEAGGKIVDEPDSHGVLDY